MLKSCYELTYLTPPAGSLHSECKLHIKFITALSRMHYFMIHKNN